MIIIMKMGAGEEEIQGVVGQIEEMGFRAHLSRGEERTIIGAVGKSTRPPKEQFLADDLEGLETEGLEAVLDGLDLRRVRVVLHDDDHGKLPSGFRGSPERRLRKRDGYTPGVMNAGLASWLFWGGMLLAMTAGFVAAFPVNYILVGRGIRHVH